MHNEKVIDKRAIRNITLSRGLIALGIGLMLWAAFNILIQSDFSGKYSSSAQADSSTSEGKRNATDLANDLPDFAYPAGAFGETKEINGTTTDKSDSTETSSKVNSNAVSLYNPRPKKGKTIGTLTIPSLKIKVPIIEGTRDRDLKKGVGHYVGSVLPGEKDNCVLSGHRDTTLRKLGKLKEGAKLIITTSAGKFTYTLSGTRIVDKEDRTVIVPTQEAVLTLTTCYPFNYVGNAPDRYVVSADLYKAELTE